MSGYEPRWDIDRTYGEQGEAVAADMIRALREDRARVEVKRKRRPDNRFYVELEQDPGRRGHYKPSGLRTTEADVWVYVIGDTGVALVILTSRLRAAIYGLGLGRDAAEMDGDCPTRGVLLSLGEITADAIDAAARSAHG